MKNIELDIRIVVTGKGRNWTAEAYLGKSKGLGSGSSVEIASSRATQNVIKAAEIEVEQVEKALEVQIWAGHRKGEKCTLISKLGETEDGHELWKVKYADGFTGTEKSKFLKALS